MSEVTPLPTPDMESSEGQLRAAVRLQVALRRTRQHELGRAVGLSQQAINDRMRGRTRFSMEDLDRFAAAFGMSPGDLLESPKRVVRPEGLEPPTFWLEDAPLAEVVELDSRRAS